jgi:hypothetical protein
METSRTATFSTIVGRPRCSAAMVEEPTHMCGYSTIVS